MGLMSGAAPTGDGAKRFLRMAAARKQLMLEKILPEESLEKELDGAAAH